MARRPAALLEELLDGRVGLRDGKLEARIAPVRQHLDPEELDRYRADGEAVASAMVDSIYALTPR